MANDTYEQRIALIRAAFGAFTTVSDAFGPQYREDARAVAISLYAGESDDVHR